MDEEDRKHIIHLHELNQLFLTKALLAISALALPLIISELGKVTGTPAQWLSGSLALFVIYILVQLYASHLSINGCALLSVRDSIKHTKGWQIIEQSKKVNKFRDTVFALALSTAAYALFITHYS